jgi:hypothetical protein
LVVVVAAAVAVAVVTAKVGGGWWNSDLKTWDAWLGNTQKLVTIVGIAGAAYLAYRRFLSGGGVLTARCELELTAMVAQFSSGASKAIVVTSCIRNEGSVDLVLLGDQRPVVEVLCLNDDLVAQGEAQGVYPWIQGHQLGGLPFRSPTGVRDHDDLEPGSKIQSTLALPVPSAGGPYRGFYVRFLVQARSANESGDGYFWTSDTVLFDVDQPSRTGNP